MRVGWLDDHSEPALRAALRAAAPEIADLPIALERAPDLGNPLWAAARATIGERVHAKFAFSEATAVRIWREAQVLAALHDRGLAVPRPVAASSDPAFSATEAVLGEPLGYPTVAAASGERVAELSDQLAGFLARLHEVRVHDAPAPDPALHVSTDDLRARFPALVEPAQRQMVVDWCDWIDDVLATPGETVFVHGDFHPYNQLWDLGEPRLVAVLDFESSGVGEPEFDLRVLPAFGPGVGLLLETVERYEARSGRKLDLARVMGHHLLNYLGDALWRTEAGIGLPEPGETPAEYVDEAAGRMDVLGL